MPPKSSSGGEKPHLGPEDFNEGPQAAARFLSAARQLFKSPVHHKSKSKSGRKTGKRN
jgi:hypothetical protein